jgi:hypothetical protein
MVAAPPCLHLPAPPATHVRVAGHAVRVCGRGVVIRGADAGSAAGKRRVTRLRRFVRRVRVRDAAVLLTRTALAWFLAHIVIRACDLARRRDVVVAQQHQLGGDGTLEVVGADRTWVMTVLTTTVSVAPTEVDLAWSDAATRRAWGPIALEKAGPPRVGAFTVTDRGIPAWLDVDRLVRLSNYDVPELDRGAISDLHAEGDAVMLGANRFTARTSPRPGRGQVGLAGPPARC